MLPFAIVEGDEDITEEIHVKHTHVQVVPQTRTQLQVNTTVYVKVDAGVSGFTLMLNVLIEPLQSERKTKMKWEVLKNEVLCLNR